MANYDDYLEYLGHVEDVSQKTHQEEIRKAVEDKEIELRHLRGDYDSSLKEKDNVISDLKAAIEQTKSELVKFYEAKLDELKTKHTKRIEELKAKAEMEKLSTEEELKKEIERLNSLISDKDDTIWEKDVTIKDYNEALEDKGKVIEDLKNKLATASIPEQKYESELKEKDELISQLKAEIAKAKRDYASTLSSQERQLSQLKAELLKTREDCEHRLKEKDAVISQLMADMDKTLQENVAPNTDQNDSVLSRFKVVFGRILHRKDVPEEPKQEDLGKWVALSRDFDRTIPFKRIRILNKRSNNERSNLHFVVKRDVFDRRRDIVNGGAGKIDFWLLNIHEGTKKTYIYDCQSVGNNMFEYEFAEKQYFKCYEPCAPNNQVWVYIEARYFALLNG